MSDRIPLETVFACAELAITWPIAQRLIASAVPPTVFARPGLVGVLEGALVVPAGWADWHDDGPGWPEVRDLVQIDLSAPETWQPLYGGCPILGLEQVDHAAIFDHPLVLHRHPLDWLRARGAGACVLDWSADLRFWIGQAPAITCATRGLAKRLKERLEECARWHQPRVTVAQTWRAAA
ncbi:hypothetical protein [Nitrospirillum iridis]|uniref:Uncharacterized protein n=1 Tax=Nitrospirillum iridis TaxID=765888 RepID=A0A7X0B1L6_9PROT|nr:hypothetical protein [Nitrospirillum iridis]MBB6254107.1 hypothetical protein [Nitrospirillum iridis]